MDNLQGKTALVTGSSQGLGKVVAQMLAKQGCHVLINCAHNVERAEQVCAAIRESGGSAEVFVCDITDQVQLKSKLPPVDILVNNARLDPYTRKDESDAEWFNKLLHVNLTGAYLAILAVADGMKERRWGRIVNVSSVQAQIAVPPEMIPYSVSKAGMHALTRSFAVMLGEYGITVNTVAPGMVITENIGKRLSEAEIEKRLHRFPLHRAATAEEIAECIVNTIGSGSMTGETVNINSGIFLSA